ncbi:MAG TPA: hypothetical protein VNW15_01550 [Rhizomicrobium sp.]|nr:hypothetical protein [Rhizomicrobium sp.]
MDRRGRFLLALAALLALASCGKPQAVSDFKTALARLSVASEQDRTTLEGYDSLLLDAQAKYELAQKDMAGDSASASADALARAADAGLVWRGTEIIDGGLSPATAAPLKRLGVVKNDADFSARSNIFIAFEDNPDDDRPSDTAEKKAARDDARMALVRQSLAVADKALKKAEDAL